MSETWLKDNPQLLNYVKIPGYSQEFRNRNNFRGGGVGAHIRKSLKYKRKRDIENLEPDLEHLWLEIPGRNHTNIRKRYKFIRHEKNFKEADFLAEFKRLPFSTVYGISDPEDKLHILNNLIEEYIDRHAPLKRTKITPPWLKDPDIVKAKAERDLLQKTARKSKNHDECQKFRDTRNRLKSSIKKAKREFTKNSYHQRNRKKVKVFRLTINPNKLNEYFSSSAKRTVRSEPTNKEQYSEVEETIGTKQ
eukprot:gene15042-6204_t